MKLLIKQGRVVDPAHTIDDVMDILVENAAIAKVAKRINSNKFDEVIDAAGKIVIPGLVDMHVHLREPGREDKETVETGTAAALRGGVTTVLAMPNTYPAIDSVAHVQLLKGIITKTAKAHVFICAAITKARLGQELTDIAALKKEGVVAISDDGASVDNAGLLLKALQEAKVSQLAVICHCEDKTLSGNGVVNRGFIATRMGLRGISNESEYSRVERDIALAEKAAASLHIAHVSCQESVELIAKAKEKGIRVTAEVTPHHLFFSEEDALGYDTNMKMNPPLRSKADREALRQALKNGTIDAIASDHAPHTENEKDIEFDRAEFGVIGLQTTLSAAITGLVETGVLDWPALVKKLSFNPAQILGIEKGTLGEGASADITIVDPAREWVVKKEDLVSKSKNSPFLGKTLKAVVTHTICAGRVAYRDEVSSYQRTGKIG